MPIEKRTVTEGWQPIAEEEMTFSQVGQIVVGTLLGYRVDDSGSREITLWDIGELGSGEVITCVGTTMLNRMLNKVHKGQEVRIEYVSEQEGSEGRNGLKVFDVRWRSPGSPD